VFTGPVQMHFGTPDPDLAPLLRGEVATEGRG
jgi:hypothetical protein